MLYLGLDVHSKWTTLVGFDPQTGEVICHKKVSNTPEGINQLLAGLPGPLSGVMEAGTNAWAMYRQLKPFFEKLLIAHPGELWDRGKDRQAKTDRRDALRMAQKLYRGEIKGIYIPDEKTQDLRTLVRGKVRASRWVTRLVNEMGALLRSWGYVGSHSLLTKSGEGDLSRAQLPEHSARVLTLWGELLEKAKEIEVELEKAVAAEAKADPVCQRLDSVPSVGPFTALLLRAELGDPTRFESAKAMVSYCGLAPQVYQSGERVSYGKLAPWGNRWLRYGLGLLAQRIGRSSKDNRLHRLYWRIQLSRDKKSAKMAVARKATHLIYYMLKANQEWQEPEEINAKPKRRKSSEVGALPA